MDTPPLAEKQNAFNNVYKGQSLWRTIKNLFLIFEKIRWLTIVIFITMFKNYILDKTNTISKWIDFYMIKGLFALYGLKIHAREREVLRYAKNHKAIFLTNLSSSFDPLIVRYL